MRKLAFVTFFCSDAYNHEAESLAEHSHRGHSFLMRSIEVPVGEKTYEIATSVHVGTRERAFAGDTSQQVAEADELTDEHRDTSAFSDGTMLRVKLK